MPDVTQLLIDALVTLRARSETDPSRELSLAITNLEQAILWFEQIETEVHTGILGWYRGGRP